MGWVGMEEDAKNCILSSRIEKGCMMCASSKFKLSGDAKKCNLFYNKPLARQLYKFLIKIRPPIQSCSLFIVGSSLNKIR